MRSGDDVTGFGSGIGIMDSERTRLYCEGDDRGFGNITTAGGGRYLIKRCTNTEKNSYSTTIVRLEKKSTFN